MRELEKVLDQHERILWEGTPRFWPFLLSGSAITTIFGLFWMIILIPFIGIAVHDILFNSHVLGFGIFLLPHFWLGIGLVFGIPVYKILVYKHTYYAITDKRVIFQKGLIGRDFEIVNFDQITNTEVNVGVFDKLFGSNSGSILVSTAGSFTYTRQRSVQKPYIIRNISDPYNVFKILKKSAHDVKTDIEYPNKLRPNKNPGYQTDYNLDK